MRAHALLDNNLVNAFQLSLSIVVEAPLGSYD
jgi:hypothetical protein